MKNKTLAAASLLLALLMPLGATPLAVYADEGESAAQTGISAVSEPPPPRGRAKRSRLNGQMPQSGQFLVLK